MTITMRRFLCLSLLVLSPCVAADWRAGVGKMKITPQGPIWLSGYGNRNKPSQGVVHDLWAKALAIEDSKGKRAVIVTTDLIGLPRAVSEQIGTEVQKRYNL